VLSPPAGPTSAPPSSAASRRSPFTAASCRRAPSAARSRAWDEDGNSVIDRVVGLDEPDDGHFVTTVLGADRYLPRSEDSVGAARELFPEGVDGALDTASLGDRIIGAVRDGGSYVTTDPRGEAMPEPQRGIRTRVTLAVGDGSRLTTLSDLARTRRTHTPGSRGLSPHGGSRRTRSPRPWRLSGPDRSRPLVIPPG
jgi:hypothetical protein